MRRRKRRKTRRRTDEEDSGKNKEMDKLPTLKDEVLERTDRCSRPAAPLRVRPQHGGTGPTRVDQVHAAAVRAGGALARAYRACAPRGRDGVSSSRSSSTVRCESSTATRTRKPATSGRVCARRETTSGRERHSKRRLWRS